MTYWEKPLVWLLTLLIDGTLLYTFSCVAVCQRPCARDWSLFLAATMVIDGINMLFLHGQFSGWSLLQGLAHVYIVARFVFHLRRKRLLIGALALLCIDLTLSLFAGAVSICLLGPDRVNALMLQWRLPRLLLSLTHLLLFLLLLPAYQLQRLRKCRPCVLPEKLSILRSVLLFIVTVISIALLFNQLPTLELSSRLNRVMLLFGITLMILVICFSYLAQDIRYLRMRRRNETLEQQKRINDALIADMRQFRGQVISMVDNLGGILSEGTLAQKRAYYEQIAHQCAQINNDNVLTLQKINDAALSTLLLRKLARCQELHLPIYLHASGPLCFNKALSPALCQAMGVLLDNAIEAAADSLYPRIVVHMDCKEKHTEIHVVNTFPATMDVDDFLRGNTVSTKAGHAGDGLQSIAALCQKYTNFNVQYTSQGRFILCTLMIL